MVELDRKLFVMEGSIRGGGCVFVDLRRGIGVDTEG
jgi:hypothetical protein